jgi:hypothetical protein
MSDADLYRQYATEAIHESSKATNENEKRTLIEFACTSWQAAVMSERVLGSSFISSRREVGQQALFSLSGHLSRFYRQSAH